MPGNGAGFRVYDLNPASAPGCAALTMLALPPRLWRAQLTRLGLLSLAVFVLTAIGADGVPPVTQVRAPRSERPPPATALHVSTTPCMPHHSTRLPGSEPR